MSDILQWVAIVGAEILGLIFVLLLIYWIKQSAKQAKDRKAVEDLVDKALASKPQREEVLRAFLSQNLGLSGDALVNTSKKILREEMRMIQTFANTYKKRDPVAASQFQIDFENAVEPYHQLQAGNISSNQSVTEINGDASTADVEALKAENHRLSEELKVTMETMSRMLEEYSTMFAGGSSGDSSVGPMPDDEVNVSAASDESDVIDASQIEKSDDPELTIESASAVVEEEPLGDDFDDLFDTDNLDELSLDEDSDGKVSI